MGMVFGDGLMQDMQKRKKMEMLNLLRVIEVL